ncbi:methyltransferase domain-containing protein [Bradyrhizobium sp.]
MAIDADGLISPPFDFNHADVSRFSPEVTGRIAINSMCERLGWSSLGGRRLLDFGCGVRFATTIINLEMEIDLYAGVDTNAAPISWLKENVRDTRLQFHHLNMRSTMYNPAGVTPTVETLELMQLRNFDAACMFSVITHQEPEDAELIFAMLRRCAPRLYFTALIDDRVRGYVEKDPQNIGHLSAYSTERLKEMLRRSGWAVERSFPPGFFQQTAFICSRAG